MTKEEKKALKKKHQSKRFRYIVKSVIHMSETSLFFTGKKIPKEQMRDHVDYKLRH